MTKKAKCYSRQAAAGDQTAADRLLELHRDQLRPHDCSSPGSTTIGPRPPVRRIAGNITEAHTKLPEYLRTQPIPFYPWLRQMAWEKIVHLHRQQSLAQARAVTREEQVEVAFPDE